MFSGPSWDKAVLFSVHVFVFSCLSCGSTSVTMPECGTLVMAAPMMPQQVYLFPSEKSCWEKKKTKPKLGGKTNRREAVSTCWLFQCLFVYPPYRHLPRDLCLWDFFVITLRRQVENGIASRRVFDVLSKRFYWPWLNIAFRRTAYRHS